MEISHPTEALMRKIFKYFAIYKVIQKLFRRNRRA